MATKQRTSHWKELTEQKTWISAVETGAILAALAYVIFAAPLGGDQFQVNAIIFSAVVGLYVIAKVSISRQAGSRWGLPFFRRSRPAWSLESTSEDTAGFVLVGATFLAGIIPIVVLKLVFPFEVRVQPMIYLPWCLIQDLVFFAIVLTNLESFLEENVAIAATAILFGLSHYPLFPLAAATALIGSVWGYIFVQTRSLGWVVVSHFLMGLCLLG